MNFILTKHAKDNLRERKIPFSLVESVLENPEQVVEEKGDERLPIAGRD